jgi:uncharacterized protein involved in high-affinity Fe2+ transport
MTGTPMRRCPAALLAALALASGAALASEEPKAKVLEAPLDPTQETVLVGRTLAGGMIIQLELEPAKAMWMPMMGEPPQWIEHAPAAGEIYHVEVKPVDPDSGTRLSYAEVTFEGVNQDSGDDVAGVLHPMWGGSGLHYAMNSALAGDGTYRAVVTVGVPTFGRDHRNVELWREPSSAAFHFKLEDGRLVEVSEPTH